MRAADALNRLIRARVRAAIAATLGSSALRIATPSAGSASTSSPLALATASSEPNSPACARPTLSTAPILGGAMSHSWAMWPMPRADISSTRYLVDSSARSTVSGRPSSLLNEPTGAIVGPSRSTTWAVRSLVEVLPDDPVIPMTVADGSRRSTSRASAPRATVTSAVTITGTSWTSGIGRWESTATAPALTAAAAKSRPSTRSPGSAANSAPGAASRESITTGPVTTAAAGPGAGGSAPADVGHGAADDRGDLGGGQRDHDRPVRVAAPRAWPGRPRPLRCR